MKAWNNRACWSGDMPIPVSFTLKTISSRPAAESRLASRGAPNLECVVVLLHQGVDGALDVGDEGADLEGLEEQLHLSRLDLREVEDVVDEGQ